MRRVNLAASLVVAATVLTACSSSSGTATPAVTTSPAASAMTTSPVSSAPMPSSSAMTTGSTAITVPATLANSAPSPVSSEESSSSSEDPTTSETTEKSGSPTTIGDSSGKLDAQTARWFTAFCGGIAPLADLEQDPSKLSAADGKSQQQTLVALFEQIGTSFTSTSTALAKLPPPTFTGGPAFAAKVVPVLAGFGAASTAAAKKAAAVDVTKDPTGLTDAIASITQSASSVQSAMGDLDNLKLTAPTEAAIEALPPCAKLGPLTG